MNKIIIVLVSIAVLFIGYQNLVVIPKEKLEAAERKELQEKMEKSRKEFQYKECMNSAFDAYSERWERTCADLGRKENCMLPNMTATSYEEDRENAENKCVTLYK